MDSEVSWLKLFLNEHPLIKEALIQLIPWLGVAFMLFQLINLLYIILFGGYGIRILDRHYSKAPEKEQIDMYSAGFRFQVYCFKYPLGLLRTRSIWVNLWMIQNSLFWLTGWIGGTLAELGAFD